MTACTLTEKHWLQDESQPQQSFVNHKGIRASLKLNHISTAIPKAAFSAEMLLAGNTKGIWPV